MATHQTMEEHIKMDMFSLNSSNRFAQQIIAGSQSGETLTLDLILYADT